MTKIIIILASLMFIFSCAQRRSSLMASNDDVPAAAIDSLHLQKELGKVLSRTYLGTIPAADCPGIVYKLTLYNQEHSGDGVYHLSMTYLEAQDGKDMTFNSEGTMSTLRGDATNPDATVYELRDYKSSQYSTYFLYQTDSLTMLDARMRVPNTTLNYTIYKQ